MSDRNQDPLQDPQLADTWNAFVHLVEAAELRRDDAGLSSRIIVRIERRARRRRLLIGAGALALAASLLVAVGIVTRAPRGEPAVALVAPDRAPPAAQVADLPLGEDDIEVAAWEDELAEETASLAGDVQALEQRWQEAPDSIALLQTQADALEREMGNGTL